MFASENIIKHGQNNYAVSYGDDASCFVEFSIEAIEDEEASAREGRPIYKDIEFITIRYAGDRNTVNKRPIKKHNDAHGPADELRFPRQYQAFKNKQATVTEGTPITEWAMISKSVALELKGLNIHTVEMLAAVSDANLSWHGARTMRDKAKAWLEQAKSGAGVSKLLAENEALRADIEALRAEIAALAADRKPAKAKKEVTSGENIT